MNWINLNDLPIVKKIINDAQLKIKQSTGADVNLALVEYNFLTGDKKEAIKDYIKNLICNFFKTNWELVTGRNREQNIIDARFAYCYLMVVVYKQSYSQTGRDLGGRDHTTIMHSVKEVKGYIEMKTEYAYTIDQLLKLLP